MLNHRWQHLLEYAASGHWLSGTGENTYNSEEVVAVRASVNNNVAIATPTDVPRWLVDGYTWHDGFVYSCIWLVNSRAEVLAVINKLLPVFDEWPRLYDLDTGYRVEYTVRAILPIDDNTPP